MVDTVVVYFFFMPFIFFFMPFIFFLCIYFFVLYVVDVHNIFFNTLYNNLYKTTQKDAEKVIGFTKSDSIRYRYRHGPKY